MTTYYDLLIQIWDAIRGRMGGVDFLYVYDALGFVIWGLLAFKVFITEGLNVAAGNHTELHKILVKYLLTIGMFAVWPTASDQIFHAIIAVVDATFPGLSNLLDVMGGAMTRMSAREEALTGIGGLITTVVGTIQNLTAGGILIIVGSLTLFLCYMLILLCIAGSITILAMNLVLGPVFFALAFDREFRTIAVHWFTAVLSYFLLIPLYGAAVRAAAAIAGSAMPEEVIGVTSTGQVFAQLIGPFLSVGIVFSTNRVVNALVGGAAGSGLASSVMGVASIIPGAAMARASGAAISQAIRTATQGGGKP
jgi:hypothetical protein